MPAFDATTPPAPQKQRRGLGPWPAARADPPSRRRQRTRLSKAGLGSQASHTASAHFAIGAWAPKTGSALPRMEPSARTKAMSNSPLPPSTEAAAAAARWAWSAAFATP
eukprot:5494224-Pyramimonas_sp.AAC.1